MCSRASQHQIMNCSYSLGAGTFSSWTPCNQQLGSRSDFATSSWNSSMSLSSIPGFDWQQDETWQRTTRVFLRGFILKVFVAKEHAFAWCASRMGASRRLPGHPARGVVRLTCFITHIRPPCQIGCVTERLLIRFGVCCCCC